MRVVLEVWGSVSAMHVLCHTNTPDSCQILIAAVCLKGPSYKTVI